MLNHFFCHLEIEPFAVSFLIAPSTKGFILLPFVMTAPYFSFVMIWPATGPYALGFVFFCDATIGTSMTNASQVPFWREVKAAAVVW